MTTPPVSPGYTAENLVAANQATTASNLSARSLLEQIFGPIANDPLAAIGGSTSAGDILGNIFMFVNMGLLTLGSIYLSYKTLQAITQTAHDGDFMGKSFHSIWVPIRITTGIGALIPVAGGWSVLQIIMLWFGIMGAGLGNMAWQGVVGAGFLPTKTLTLSPPTGSSFDRRFVPELFKMHACVLSHNAQYGEDVPWGVKKQLSQTAMAGYYSFGSKGGFNSECGKITLASIYKSGGSVNGGFGASKGVTSNYSGAWGGGLGELGIRNTAQRAAISAAAQAQFDALNDAVGQLAFKFIGTPTCKDSGVCGVATIINSPDEIQTIVRPDPVMLRNLSVKYQASLSDAVAHAMTSTDALPAATEAMKLHATQDGFTTAGAWYMTMAQTSYAMNSLTQNITPSITSTAQAPTSTDSVYIHAFKLIEESERAQQEGALNVGGSSGNQDTAWKLIMKEMDHSSIGQNVINSTITEGSGKPVMVRVKDLADRMISVAAAAVTAVGAVDGLLEKGITGAVANTFGGAAVGALQPWLHMITFVCQLAIGFFLAASILIPMIPFIIFMGQVLNWLITVVEGVAAAPFLGFAHLDTDGEGLGHKTEYGYVFMLQSFMRPVMLVLGFVFACMLLEAMGGWLMAIYPLAVANAQMDSMTGFFSLIGYSALFMVLVGGLINSCMSVMYILPDAIFRFIGAQSSATGQMGRDMGEKATAAALGGAGVARQAQPIKSINNGRGEQKNGLQSAAPVAVQHKYY